MLSLEELEELALTLANDAGWNAVGVEFDDVDGGVVATVVDENDDVLLPDGHGATETEALADLVRGHVANARQWAAQCVADADHAEAKLAAHTAEASK
jgi:uncharacterized protein YjlB